MPLARSSGGWRYSRCAHLLTMRSLNVSTLIVSTLIVNTLIVSTLIVSTLIVNTLIVNTLIVNTLIVSTRSLCALAARFAPPAAPLSTFLPRFPPAMAPHDRQLDR